MAINGNNLEPEFDALLKVHVRQQSNVQTCAQFDPDSTAAYLEQSLSKAAHNTFELHLASCAICRHHLIELSRLMPVQAVAPEPVNVPTTFKARWREWFSGWRLGAVAGLGAVAATLLMVTVFMNRSVTNMSPMVAENRETSSGATLPTPAVVTVYNNPQEQADKPMPSGSPAATATPMMRDKEAAKVVVPESLAAPTQGQVEASVSQEAPPPPPPAPTPAPGKESERKEAAAQPVTIAPGAVAPPSQVGNFRAPVPSGPASNQMAAERALEVRKREAQQTTDTVAPVRSASKSPDPAADRSAEKAKKDVADESDRKRPSAKPEARAVANKPAPPRPSRTIGGKSFFQENGVWVDESYPANRNLPLVRLTRDSEEYNQTLKDTPALKPYFDLKPVVVVWQGKVYRVEHK